MVWQGSGSCQSVGYVYSMGRRSSRHMRNIDCISFGFVRDDSMFCCNTDIVWTLLLDHFVVVFCNQDERYLRY